MANTSAARNGVNSGFSGFVPASCRIAIRICVGRLPSGRESYRTVNIHGVRHDVTVDAALAAARALAPILDGRIALVSIVRKFCLRFAQPTGDNPAPASPLRSLPAPLFPASPFGRNPCAHTIRRRPQCGDG